jgi:hypothetical protein
MLNAIHEFEQVCHDHGVVPQVYDSNNATIFTSESMAVKLKKFAQIIMFAGTGAHHHNGMAERAIGMSTNMARMMMLHAAIHWPDATDATQWLMAVTHATYLYNHMPCLEARISSVDLFTKMRWEQKKFHDCHAWGCPMYVLDKTVGNGKKKRSGSHDLSKLSTWGTHQNIPAQCHLS